MRRPLSNRRPIGNGGTVLNNSLEVEQGMPPDEDDVKTRTGFWFRFPLLSERRKGRAKQTLGITTRRLLLRCKKMSPNLKTSRLVVVVSFCLFGFVLFVLEGRHDGSSTSRKHEVDRFARRTTVATVKKAKALTFDVNIVFQQARPNEILKIPRRWSLEDKARGYLHDFGGLDIKFFVGGETRRQIIQDFSLYASDFREWGVPRDDDVEAYVAFVICSAFVQFGMTTFFFRRYYAFDDDLERNDFAARYDGLEEEAEDIWCRRVREHRYNFQNCNTFHEVSLVESGVTFVGEGAYRQVMAIDHYFGNLSEKIVVKDIHHDFQPKYDHFEYVRMDALVAERLTGSPRIYDIYGMCGLGIMSEFFPLGDLESVALPEDNDSSEDVLFDPQKPLEPRNDLTGLQKLEIGKQMAEALADLHGNQGGTIVHQDVQLSQFLWSGDKSLVKLNDFNRAEFLLWDENANIYCDYFEGPGNGNWRSPEEYDDNRLNEKVDVFSMGNNLYSLLTGLQPFQNEYLGEMKRRVREGEKAFIDPRFRTDRGVAEARLADIIDRCHETNPDDRPSMFELVELLRRAIHDTKKDKSE